MLVKTLRQRLAALLAAALLTGCTTTGGNSAPTPTLFLIGDSITANKTPEAHPETGWGQVLPDYLTGQLQIANHARNGRSSKSFRDEGLWQEVYDRLQPGDFLVIGFAHNDQKSEDPSRYAEAWGDYKRNLETYIDEARAKQVSVILVTPVYRRRFDAQGQPENTLGEYPLAVRQLAAEQMLPLVDLNAWSRSLLSQYGQQESARLYLNLAPGEHSNYPDGKEDNTHLQPEGAHRIARFFIRQLQAQGVAAGQYFQTDPRP